MDPNFGSRATTAADIKSQFSENPSVLTQLQDLRQRSYGLPAEVLGPEKNSPRVLAQNEDPGRNGYWFPAEALSPEGEGPWLPSQTRDPGTANFWFPAEAKGHASPPPRTRPQAPKSQKQQGLSGTISKPQGRSQPFPNYRQTHQSIGNPFNYPLEHREQSQGQSLLGVHRAIGAGAAKPINTSTDHYQRLSDIPGDGRGRAPSAYLDLPNDIRPVEPVQAWPTLPIYGYNCEICGQLFLQEQSWKSHDCKAVLGTLPMPKELPIQRPNPPASLARSLKNQYSPPSTEEPNLRLTIMGASNLPKSGLFSSPDPYTEILLDGRSKYTTPVVKCTKTPVWCKSYDLHVRRDSVITIDVRDARKDQSTIHGYKGKFLGSVEIKMLDYLSFASTGPELVFNRITPSQRKRLGVDPYRFRSHQASPPPISRDIRNDKMVYQGSLEFILITDLSGDRISNRYGSRTVDFPNKPDSVSGAISLSSGTSNNGTKERNEEPSGSRGKEIGDALLVDSRPRSAVVKRGDDFSRHRRATSPSRALVPQTSTLGRDTSTRKPASMEQEREVLNSQVHKPDSKPQEAAKTVGTPTVNAIIQSYLTIVQAEEPEEHSLPLPLDIPTRLLPLPQQEKSILSQQGLESQEQKHKAGLPEASRWSETTTTQIGKAQLKRLPQQEPLPERKPTSPQQLQLPQRQPLGFGSYLLDRPQQKQSEQPLQQGQPTLGQQAQAHPEVFQDYKRTPEPQKQWQPQDQQPGYVVYQDNEQQQDFEEQQEHERLKKLLQEQDREYQQQQVDSRYPHPQPSEQSQIHKPPNRQQPSPLPHLSVKQQLGEKIQLPKEMQSTPQSQSPQEQQQGGLLAEQVARKLRVLPAQRVLEPQRRLQRQQQQAMCDCPICRNPVKGVNINSHIDSGCESLIESPFPVSASTKPADGPGQRSFVSVSSPETPATKRAPANTAPQHQLGLRLGSAGPTKDGAPQQQQSQVSLSTKLGKEGPTKRVSPRSFSLLPASFGLKNLRVEEPFADKNESSSTPSIAAVDSVGPLPPTQSVTEKGSTEELNKVQVISNSALLEKAFAAVPSATESGNGDEKTQIISNFALLEKAFTVAPSTAESGKGDEKMQVISNSALLEKEFAAVPSAVEHANESEKMQAISNSALLEKEFAEAPSAVESGKGVEGGEERKERIKEQKEDQKKEVFGSWLKATGALVKPSGSNKSSHGSKTQSSTEQTGPWEINEKSKPGVRMTTEQPLERSSWFRDVERPVRANRPREVLEIAPESVKVAVASAEGKPVDSPAGAPAEAVELEIEVVRAKEKPAVEASADADASETGGITIPAGLSPHQMQAFQKMQQMLRLSQNSENSSSQTEPQRSLSTVSTEASFVSSSRTASTAATTIAPPRSPFGNSKERLAAFFPHITGGNRTSYTDSEIYEISSLLKHSESTWSKVPRTYIVLRTIGRLDLLNEFIDLGFSDHWFPVTTRSLPQRLSPTIRGEFVKAQDLVLTKSIDLEKGEDGRHKHFAKGEVIPFQRKAVLGKGGFGQVDRVLSLISYKEYARKCVRRRIVFGNQGAEATKRFIEEVEILKRLKHRHMVEFVGSYTDPTYLCLIMSPVAEMDLAEYLQDTSTKKPELRTFFGCLAMALQYLHDHQIRHKDIKPGNILVNHGNVLFTDFGLSRDSTDATGSTTSGAASLSPRYCAPEVAAYESRNSSSDIWSLGVVFFEMVITLKGLSIDYMRSFFTKHGNEQSFIRTNPKAFIQMLAELKGKGMESDNKSLDWVRDMVQVDRTARPTAARVVEMIISPNGHGERDGRFCGICCMSGEESEAEDSFDDPDEGFGED